MFWQAIDPIAAIRELGEAIFHVHAKDTQIYDRNLPLTGVLDTKRYTDEAHRAWIFRTCGYGHGEEWWREFVSTLRMFGYDYAIDRARGQHPLARGRAHEGDPLPGFAGGEGEACGGMVGVGPNLFT